MTFGKSTRKKIKSYLDDGTCSIQRGKIENIFHIASILIWTFFIKRNSSSFFRFNLPDNCRFSMEIPTVIRQGSGTFIVSFLEIFLSVLATLLFTKNWNASCFFMDSSIIFLWSTPWMTNLEMQYFLKWEMRENFLMKVKQADIKKGPLMDHLLKKNHDKNKSRNTSSLSSVLNLYPNSTCG